MTSVLIRFIGVALTFGLVATLPPMAFKAVFVSMLFGHYALSFWFARRQYQTVFNNADSRKRIFALLAISTLYFVSGTYLVAQAVFTIFHIALSDTYMVNDILNLNSDTTTQKVRWHLNLSRFGLSTFSFFFLFHDYPIVRFFSPEITVTIIFGFAIYLLVTVYVFRQSLLRKAIGTYLGFEALLLVVTILLYWQTDGRVIQQLVYYHVIIWAVFPLLMAHSRHQPREMLSFAALTLVSTVFFAVLRLPVFSDRAIVNLDSQIPFWASVHFITTLFTSRYNPIIIRGFFVPTK